MPCSGCASALPVDARFCPSCGRPCAPPPAGSVEQRKLVTALFCDLVGSTELSGVLEPETLRAVVLRYFDTMRGRIEAHGGTVEKFIGDAVMAVFGVPVVHEDDARRAAAAALDMVAALAELNADLQRDVGCVLAVRIGVNTGEVVTTAEEGTNENLVSGEVVNVAARLEQRAGPGEILIGPITRGLLGATATVEPVGELSLKGKRDTVSAFRLRAVGPPVATLTDRSDDPFVGRATELARLREVWSSVSGGHGGRQVVVHGDAGIGKTELLREWLATLPADGALVGFGCCHPYRDQPSLTPVAQALRQVLDTATGHGLLTGHTRDGAAYRELYSGLLRDGTPGRSADSTCAALATVLADLAGARPVVLVLDDLHWADPMLLDAMAALADRLHAERVLLVGAGRVVGTADTPFGTLPELDLGLAPLSPAESAQLLAGLVELQPHDATGLASVTDRAEGNPLFLRQLLAMLDDGTGTGELPATVTAVLAARVDALPRDERATVDAAAVAGRQFQPRIAQELAGTSPAALHELVRRGMVESVVGQEPDYRFGSGLLRDVAYRSISKRRRADWHELLGRAPTASEPAMAGHHLEQAYRHRCELGLRDERTETLRAAAARMLTDAGRVALARADLSWSADLSGRAIGLSTTDDTWWTDAAQCLGETWLAVGRFDEGSDLLRDVAVVAAATGDRLAEQHALLRLAALDSRPGPFSAAAAARSALPVFEAYDDRLGLARAHVRLAQEQQFLGAHRTAEGLLTVALEHATAAGATAEHAMALGALGMSLWHGPTPAAEAVRRARTLLDTYGRDQGAVVVTLGYPLAGLLALQGLDGAALDCLATANRCASSLGFAEATVLDPLFTAGVEAHAGRLRPAERLLRLAIHQCETAGDPRLAAAASRDLARVLLRLGERPGPDLLDADTVAEQPAEAADQLGVLAMTEALGGDADRALRLTERAVAAAEATDSPTTRATAQLDRARTCLTLGRSAVAVDAADHAARLFADKGHVVGVRHATSVRDSAVRGDL